MLRANQPTARMDWWVRALWNASSPAPVAMGEDAPLNPEKPQSGEGAENQKQGGKKDERFHCREMGFLGGLIRGVDQQRHDEVEKVPEHQGVFPPTLGR